MNSPMLNTVATMPLGRSGGDGETVEREGPRSEASILEAMANEHSQVNHILILKVVKLAALRLACEAELSNHGSSLPITAHSQLLLRQSSALIRIIHLLL